MLPLWSDRMTDDGRRKHEMRRSIRLDGERARVIASRVMVVIAAASLVGGFAIATFVPPDMPLGQVLLQEDHASVARLHATVLASFPRFVWESVVLPLLMRPAWLSPVMLGIVACGLAISFRPRAAPPKRPRMR